jgi:hypothetical protein
LPLSYTSDPQHLYQLPDFTAIDAPGLVWSARSAWRRGISKLVSDQREQRWRQAPVIRLGLHPVDMRHEFSRTYWLQTLKRLLAEGRSTDDQGRLAGTTLRAHGSRRMSRGFLLFLGLLAAVLIPWLLGGSEIWSRLQSFPLSELLIMFGMILLCWLINTLRLRLLLGDQRDKVSRSKASGW